MNLMVGTWIVSALAIAVLAAFLGRTRTKSYLGILIDTRGRYSLSHFQIVLWSIVVLSLISGVFWARLLSNVPDPLNFAIPDELLLVMGISVGSAATATAVKAGKDAVDAARLGAKRIASFRNGAPAHLAQIFLVEEGKYADQIVDVAKFQNFWITVVLVVAYIALALATIRDPASAASVTALPGLAGPFVTLLGISHAGYIGGKIPDRAGQPDFGFLQRQAKAGAKPIGFGAGVPVPGVPESDPLPPHHPEHGHGYIHLTCRNKEDSDAGARGVLAWAATPGKLQEGEWFPAISAMQDLNYRKQGELVIILAHLEKLTGHSDAAHNRMKAIALQLASEVERDQAVGGEKKMFMPNPDHFCCWSDHP